MEVAVAQAVTQATYDQARRDARNDLAELRRQAAEAGRERSRRLIKVSTIDESAGVVRYNPSGRLLRDWYMHVYLNTLRGALGEPSVHIDAQQVEDLAALLRRVRPNAEPLRALQAVGVVRNVAIDDANHAALTIVERLKSVGAGRAVRHAPDERFEGDELRVHVTRHWYLRCYSAHVEEATRSQQPLTGITGAEHALVAKTLATREVRRVIGRDGVPLVTAHNTRMNEVDRALARGDVGVIPPSVLSSIKPDPFDTLRRQVKSTWSGLTDDRRALWVRLAGGEAINGSERWVDLTGDQQSKVIRNYLASRPAGLRDTALDQALIPAAPAVAARRMFNHREPLTEPTRPSISSEVPSGGLGADDVDVLERSAPPIRGLR